MKKLVGLALLTLSLLLNSPAQTAQRGAEVRIRNERGQVEAVKLYGGSYALVIGAANYRHWAKLGGVRDDIPAVRAVLERHGFKVEELSNPTGDDLLARINKFINDYGLYPDNRLLIYFSGHGYTEVSSDGRKIGYVVPVDAPNPSKDIIGFQQKAFTMDEVETAARRIRSKHALFVFDSCFSGTLVNKGDVRVPPVIDYYATQPVRQFITAGADNQEVPEESVFRQVFVRGLEGEADFNKDGYITGTELATYLQEQVIRYRGQAQTPQYGKIRDPLLDKGDFIFILPDPTLNDGKTARARELAAQALATLMRGDYSEALKLANQSLSLDSSVALAYAVRGRSSHKLDQEETGLADLETANRLDKGSGLLRALLSVSYWDAKKDELSKTTAEEALKLLVSPNGAAEFSARGVAHFVAGNYDAAIADYDKAVGLNSEYFGAYYNRGLAYYYKKEYVRAIADYDKAIKLNPRDGGLFVNRGVAYYWKGDLGRALKDYDEAIRINPKQGMAFYNRGFVYEDVGRYDEALKDFTEVIALDHQHFDALYKRGQIYGAKGDFAKAITDMSVVLNSNPQDTDALFYRAALYAAKGNNKDALADLEKVIKLEPESGDTYTSRGYVYFSMEENTKALADFNKAIEINPKDSGALSGRGSLYVQGGRYDQAIADFTQAVTVNPEDFRGYLNLGFIYAEKGDYVRANEYFKRLKEVIKQSASDGSRKLDDVLKKRSGEYLGPDPQKLLDHFTAGISFMAAKDFDKAANEYSQALKEYSQFTVLYLMRGWAYYLEGDYNAALLDTKILIASNSEDVAAYSLQGDIYLGEGNYKQAIASYSEVIRLSPDNVQAYRDRANAYEKLGDRSKAKADRQKADALEGRQINR